MSNNSNLTALDKVVFNNVEWVKVPGYLRTYVTKDGNVCEFINGKYRVPTIHKWHSPTGYYLYAAVITDDIIVRQKAIHQLVCLTFNGPPPDDSKKYEPNHINGIKNDNRAINLEWMTRSQNVQHAFDSGLCTSGVRVEARNILTGQIQQYNSLNSMSKSWGIPRYILKSIIAKHKLSPYLGEWLFTLDDASDKKISRYQAKSIIFKDYVSGGVYITADAEAAMQMSGIKVGTIISKTRGKVKNTLALVGRYVFQLSSELKDWPIYSAEEALKADEIYHNRKDSQKNIPCVMKNYLTGEVYYGKSYIELGRIFSRLTGKNFRSLIENMYDGNLRPCKGYIMKRQDDPKPWPVYSEEEVRKSLQRWIKKKILMTDVLSDTTKIYPNKESLKIDIGISEKLVR